MVSKANLKDYFFPASSDMYNYFVIIEGADPSTFNIIHEKTNYTRDEKNIFYSNKKVKSVDEKTFHVFVENRHDFYAKDEFGVDKDHVFLYGEKVEGSHSPSFRFISSYYAADNSSIYFVALDGVKVVTGINAKTIKRFPEDSSYRATEDAVFYRGLILENAKLQSFEIIKYSKNNFTSTDYSKDKNHVYHAGAILKDADPATFEDIGE